MNLTELKDTLTKVAKDYPKEMLSGQIEDIPRIAFHIEAQVSEISGRDPKDLTVCGFDDTEFARSIWPELTTIHQPIADMSRAAVLLLVQKIRERRAGENEDFKHALLDFTLVRRDSDGVPAR